MGIYYFCQWVGCQTSGSPLWLPIQARPPQYPGVTRLQLSSASVAPSHTSAPSFGAVSIGFHSLMLSPLAYDRFRLKRPRWAKNQLAVRVSRNDAFIQNLYQSRFMMASPVYIRQSARWLAPFGLSPSSHIQIFFHHVAFRQRAERSRSRRLAFSVI